MIKGDCGQCNDQRYYGGNILLSFAELMTGEKSENPLHHNETHCQNDSEGRQKCYYVPDDVHNNKAKVFMRKDRGKLSMLQQRGQFLRIIRLNPTSSDPPDC